MFFTRLIQTVEPEVEEEKENPWVRKKQKKKDNKKWDKKKRGHRKRKCERVSL